MLMGLPDRWDTCSRTIFLEGRPSAFAYWGDIVAIGSESSLVLLDAITGIKMSVLCGHRDKIRSLSFSLGGTLLFSRSDDKTVKIWDVQTGGVIRTFSDATSVALAASISPDGTKIALGTKGGEIRLWDVRTGKCHSIKTGQDDVGAVSFSPINSRRLISSSWSGTVRQWDVDGRQIGPSHHEADGVSDLAYTLDGTRFVSCGGTVATVRDSKSGSKVVKLRAPNRAPLNRCCFSPDGKFVACAAGTTICVWDITVSGARLVGPLVGHSDLITFVAFSSSLISGSWDQSVKFWQSSSFLADSTATDNMAALHDSTPIVSVNLFAEYATVVTTDSSGLVKTWNLTTGRSESSFSTPAKGECDTHLASDTLTIVWFTEEKREYQIWDVYKGQLLRSFYSSLPNLRDLKISGDGSKIFGFGIDHIEAVSMHTGEYGGRVEHGIPRGSGIFVRGSKVGIDNSGGSGWDFGGVKVSYFKELPDRPRLDLVDLSTGDGSQPRWIEDTVTKRPVFRLPERYMKSDTKRRWDGRYLLVWSRSGEVVIMDFDCVCPRLVSSSRPRNLADDHRGGM